MTRIRIALTVAAALAFLSPAAISRLAPNGSPKGHSPLSAIQPNAALPTFRPMGSDPQSQKLLAEEKERREKLARAAETGARDPVLNQLRRDVITAANAYLPCDRARQRSFVSAAQKYYDLLEERTSCLIHKCAPDAWDKVAQLRTDLDRDVGEAVQRAVSRGGISAWDFRLRSQGAMVVESLGARPAPTCPSEPG